MRVANVAAASVLLAGCFPFPHRANVTPPVEGVITRSNTPVANASVTVCEATATACCVGKEQRAQTDAQGRFSVAPSRETRWMMYVMAHRQFHWCLAVEGDTPRRLDGPYSQYTLVDSGPAFSESVSCSIAQETLSCTGAGTVVPAAPNTSLERTRDR